MPSTSVPRCCGAWLPAGSGCLGALLLCNGRGAPVSGSCRSIHRMHSTTSSIAISTASCQNRRFAPPALHVGSALCALRPALRCRNDRTQDTSAGSASLPSPSLFHSVIVRGVSGAIATSRRAHHHPTTRGNETGGSGGAHGKDYLNRASRPLAVSPSACLDDSSRDRLPSTAAQSRHRSNRPCQRPPNTPCRLLVVGRRSCPSVRPDAAAGFSTARGRPRCALLPRAPRQHGRKGPLPLRRVSGGSI